MQLTWEKYLQIIFLIKDLYSEYIKDSQLNNETNTQFKNGRNSNRHSPEGYIQIAIKCMKKCSILLVIRKVVIKTRPAYP